MIRRAPAARLTRTADAAQAVRDDRRTADRRTRRPKLTGVIEADLPGAHVLFTDRHGGVSAGPFASLNLGPWTDDDPVAVRENRGRVADRVGRRLVGVKQVHGTTVLREGRATSLQEADGVATARTQVAPIVLAADCLPVAIASDHAVAMVHAGWRGLAAGVLEEGVAAVRALGDADAPVHAVVGPGAGACCYVVSDDVAVALATRRSDAGTVDLKAVAAARLGAAGVAGVHDVGRCTMCDEAFFSHRRDGGRTGRQAGVAWRRASSAG